MPIEESKSSKLGNMAFRLIYLHISQFRDISFPPGTRWMEAFCEKISLNFFQGSRFFWPYSRPHFIPDAGLYLLNRYGLECQKTAREQGHFFKRTRSRGTLRLCVSLVDSDRESAAQNRLAAGFSKDDGAP